MSLASLPAPMVFKRLAKSTWASALLSTLCLLPALALSATGPHSAGHHHIVTKGETLWGIADQYLNDPEKWRRLWKLNRHAIRNPNRIYPGQEIDLDKLEKLLEAQPIYLNPGEEIVTGELLPALGLTGAPSLKSDRTASFVVKKGDTLWGIAATRYKNHWQWKKIWKLNKKSIRNPNRIYPGQVFTLAEPLPLEPGAIAPATVQPAAVPAAIIKPAPQPTSAQPAPPAVVSSRIISIYTGTSQANDRMIVVIDKGRLNGLENGQTLTLYHTDEDGGTSNAASTPSGTGYGQIQVFRIFDKTAYATITQANGQVKLLDTAATH